MLQTSVTSHAERLETNNYKIIGWCSDKPGRFMFKWNNRIVSDTLLTVGWSDLQFKFSSAGESARLLRHPARSGLPPQFARNAFTVQVSALSSSPADNPFLFYSNRNVLASVEWPRRPLLQGSRGESGRQMVFLSVCSSVCLSVCVHRPPQADLLYSFK